MGKYDFYYHLITLTHLLSDMYPHDPELYRDFVDKNVYRGASM